MAGLSLGDYLLNTASAELLQSRHLSLLVLHRLRLPEGKTQSEVNSVALRCLGTMLNVSVDPLACEVRHGTVRVLKFYPGSTMPRGVQQQYSSRTGPDRPSVIDNDPIPA